MGIKSQRIDLIDQVFGRLTVIKETDSYINPKGKKYLKWLCKCECGNLIEVVGNHLKKGNTKSCGCFQKERVTELKTKHGCSNKGKVTKEYIAYTSMKARTLNPKHENYKYYGARGITVCDRWLDPEYGFKYFLEDIGYAPSSKHSLDRIDVNGCYCKENCRWTTRTVQSINQRISSKNKSGTRGVHWCKKRKKWCAAIRVNYKHINLGSFSNIEDAIAARKEAEEIYHQPLVNAA
jgi:hypothetical protein